MMRWFLLILFLCVAAVFAYGFVRDPNGCAKLGADLKTDLAAIYVPGASASPEANTVAGDVPATAASQAGAGDTAPVATGVGASATPGGTAATTAGAASSAAWNPPAVIPAQPNWVWTTPDRVYRDVTIEKVEADCVTIHHADGRSVVAIWTLPAEIQKELNYDPVAAAAAGTQREKDNPAPAPETIAEEKAAPQPAVLLGETTDYARALSVSKSTGRPMLLHFTGSDWCPYCQKMDAEVFSTADFNRYVSANYILVTLDFPHQTPMSDDLKQQNASLAQKYRVSGFPTLVVVNSEEKELGRTSGYNPGSGPATVIDQLRSFGP